MADLLTWTLKMSLEQADAWDELAKSVGEAAGRRRTGREKVTRKVLVEELVELARTDSKVRDALIKAVAAKTPADN